MLFLLQSIFASEIQIRDITYSGSDRILLSDIAIFKGVSREQKEQIGAVILATDLKLGVERVFSRESLVEILKKYQPKNGRITFIIPETAVVKRQEDQFGKINVEKKITEAIERNHLGMEVKVDALNFPTLNGAIIDWEVVVPNQVISSNIVVPIKYTIRHNGIDIDKSDSVSVRVKMYQTVPVVKDNTFQGQRLAAEQLQLKTIEVSRNQLYVSNLQDIIGKKLKRHLRQGEAIRITDLEVEYSVRAGESVMMTVTENEISVRMQGIAKQNGSIGDVIRINNPMNNRLVFGTVTGSSEVEVK
jgi:flagella basal body P-ring formation protein FlgA